MGLKTSRTGESTYSRPLKSPVCRLAVRDVDQFSDMRYIGSMNTEIIKQIERSSLRDQIYEALKRAIVMLELKPGERIKDSVLAERFGVSRTPVREALKRLEDEGLVTSIPGSMTKVTEIDMETARHAFEVIATLHELATRLAIPKLEEADIQLLEERNEEFRTALESGDVIRAVEADDGFHNVFLVASGNTQIEVALERIIPKIRRLEYSKLRTSLATISFKQHQEIIAASKDRDIIKASNLVKMNWVALEEILLV
jgi:DNA-binding GntR family transcriptional regulator